MAQHLTDYGRDLKIKDGLATLLDELCGVLPEDTWLRLMYAYPHGISDQLIATMARHPQICAYLDMPLQHAHPDTLRRMRRPPDTDRTKSIIRDLRAAMPDIALRSTFIVGFPGETREEFTRAPVIPGRSPARSGRRVPLLAGARHARRHAARPGARRA